MPQSHPAHIARIEAVYSKLPKMNCKRKCQEACGPILMSQPEWERIIRRLGYEPSMFSDEMICPMLNRESGQCSVYNIRPLVCRLYGMVKRMTCPFGCEPERWITENEARGFIAELESLEAEKV